MILMMIFHENLAPAMSLLIISQLGAFILVVTIAQNGLWSKNMSKDSKSTSAFGGWAETMVPLYLKRFSMRKSNGPRLWYH